MTTQKPEALIFANDRPSSIGDDLYQWASDAEDMIRRQHARIVEFEAQLGAQPSDKDLRDKVARALGYGTGTNYAWSYLLTQIESLVECEEELIAMKQSTHPTQQGMDAGKLLAEKHTGMKVDYRGLLGQVRRSIKHTSGGHEEMLRQLEGHITELGQRWYAGDTAVVDELLQLYCVEREARAALAAQAKQGEQP